MAENGEGMSAVKVAVYTILAVVLLLFGIKVFNLGFGFANESFTDASNAVQVAGEAKYLSYNNTTVYGSDVVNLIRTSAGTNFIVTVTTTSSATPTPYTTKQGYTVSAVSDVKYINPNGMFSSTITRNANNVVTGVTFVQN